MPSQGRMRVLKKKKKNRWAIRLSAGGLRATLSKRVLKSQPNDYTNPHSWIVVNGFSVYPGSTHGGACVLLNSFSGCSRDSSGKVGTAPVDRSIYFGLSGPVQ